VQSKLLTEEKRPRSLQEIRHFLTNRAIEYHGLLYDRYSVKICSNRFWPNLPYATLRRSHSYRPL